MKTTTTIESKSFNLDLNNNDTHSLKATVKSDNQEIADVPVKLLNHSRNILETQNTNSEGIVTFNDLETGDYFLRINKQSGYESFEDHPIKLDNDMEVTLELIKEG